MRRLGAVPVGMARRPSIGLMDVRLHAMIGAKSIGRPHVIEVPVREDAGGQIIRLYPEPLQRPLGPAAECFARSAP